MLEVLRVLGGFESSWNWSEGGDPDDPQESDPLCQETGIFQVSANSMEFDASLRQCVIDYCGADDPETFIRQMKLKWCFAVEYCARLLRFSIDWDGPISRGEIHPWLSRDAMAEFETPSGRRSQRSTVGGIEMIRVTVELVSAIDPSRSRLLGIAEIANDVKTTAETGGLFGSYNVRVADPEAPLEDFIVRLSKWAPKERETWKRGRVEKFDQA